MTGLKNILDFILGNVYLRFLMILAGSVVLGWLGKLILIHVIRPIAKKTKTKVDDLVVRRLSSIVFYVIVAVGAEWGLRNFELQTSVLNSVVDSLLILIIAWFILRVVSDLSRHWLLEWAAKTDSTADDRLIPLIEKIVKAVIIILAVIFLFSAWNVDISPLLATAGIAGIAISFAVKDSLSNILGGLQLVLDRTFKVGDKIELESGEMGVVLDIGLRSTKLRTFDNEIIFIPNGSLANAKIKNFTVPDLSVRVNVEFGVEYGADPEKVRGTVLKAMEGIDGVCPEPAPVVQFLKMSDFSLDFIARVWVNSYAQAFSMKLAVTEAVYNALNQAGIGIPFPTRTVYTKQED